MTQGLKLHLLHWQTDSLQLSLLGCTFREHLSMGSIRSRGAEVATFTQDLLCSFLHYQFHLNACYLLFTLFQTAKRYQMLNFSL